MTTTGALGSQREYMETALRMGQSKRDALTRAAGTSADIYGQLATCVAVRMPFIEPVILKHYSDALEGETGESAERRRLAIEKGVELLSDMSRFVSDGAELDPQALEALADFGWISKNGEPGTYVLTTAGKLVLEECRERRAS